MKKLEFLEIIQHLKSFSFPKVDLIVGIARGGVIPAYLVGAHLNRDVKIIRISFRDDENKPLFDEPQLKTPGLPFETEGKKILIVDDVSVTGKTMDKAIGYFTGHQVQTFALKGKADFVLFPDIKECVHWPWKEGNDKMPE